MHKPDDRVFLQGLRALQINKGFSPYGAIICAFWLEKKVRRQRTKILAKYVIIRP